ncbi:MAG: hypothetical protein ABI399_06415 [Bauldia sp.]
MFSASNNVERGSPSLVEALRHHRVVYISPRFDDIAFSLGITARSIGSGTILNLFTRTRHIVNPALARGRAWTTEEVVAQRDGEDARFAAAIGLDRRSLDLDEPALRGRRHRDPGGVADDRGQLSPVLARALENAAGDSRQPRALFCPAAIGEHVNHRATLEEVVDLLPVLTRSWRVFFYEDLPYASRWWKRQNGLRRLRRRFAGRAIRHVLWLGKRGDDKLALVALYESQHRRAPPSRRFSPWTTDFAPPHEAFWEFPP